MIIVPLAIVASVILVLGLMLAFGTAAPPPEMRSVTTTAQRIDRSDLPPISRYRARDGAELAYRAYPASHRSVAIAIHGSAEGSTVMHGIAKTLQTSGVTVYAPDIRGHGQSGQRGDIDYLGQLDNDLADLIALTKQQYPKASLTLVAFSSGGGFAVRVAGGRNGDLFDRYVLLSPTLPPSAPTFRAGGGGWVSPYIPRIVALRILSRLGIHWFDGLPVLAFALAPGASEVTKTYSARLAQNFAADQDWAADFRNARRPMAVLIGGDDEINIADRFVPALQPLKPDLKVSVIEGVGHIALLSDPRALDALRREFAASAPGD
jgi:non-heme chloroperoxidase